MEIPKSKKYGEISYKDAKHDNVFHTETSQITKNYANITWSDKSYALISKIEQIRSTKTVMNSGNSKTSIVKYYKIGEGIALMFNIAGKRYYYEYADKNLKDFKIDFLVKLGCALECEAIQQSRVLAGQKAIETAKLKTQKLLKILENGTNNPFILEIILNDKELKYVNTKAKAVNKKLMKNKDTFMKS